MARTDPAPVDHAATPGDTSPEAVARARKAVVASSIGNALEWFDIIVYSSFAVVISELFFPDVSGFAALMLTFLTFAVSYLIRPLGAAVIGSWADRHGRKRESRLCADRTLFRISFRLMRVRMRATVQFNGEERSRIWNKVVAEAPGFGAYEKKVNGRREIPVVELTPV